MAGEITPELLRTRAEHNEGILISLEEIALHQQDLEGINKVLGRCCPRLKILLLQGNKISKLENLNRLKDLTYLNVAVNRLERVEGLQSCEFLSKLDFTANFIDDLLSFESLKNNGFLRELYIIGNPCTEFEFYKEFLLATLPQLTSLDGNTIEPCERIVATEKLQDIKQQLESRPIRPPPPLGEEKEEEEEEEEKNEEKKSEEPTMDEYFEDINKKKNYNSKFKDDGTVRQRNEGGFEFNLQEQDTEIVLDLSCPRFLDTSLIHVDVQPNYIEITIKGKLLRLSLPQEVSPDRSKASRCTPTGHLIVTMPLISPIVTPFRHQEPDSSQRKVTSDKSTVVDYRNIVAKEEGREKVKESHVHKEDEEVPPLEDF